MSQHDAFNMVNVMSELTDQLLASSSSQNLKNGASSIESKDISAFQKFVELPGELQLKIWEHSLPGPRIIELFAIEGANSDGPLYSVSADPIPQLQICHDSRTIASKVFREGIPEIARMYLNPATDHLWIRKNVTLPIYTPEGTAWAPDARQPLTDEEIEAQRRHSYVCQPFYSDDLKFDTLTQRGSPQSPVAVAQELVRTFNVDLARYSEIVMFKFEGDPPCSSAYMETLVEMAVGEYPGDHLPVSLVIPRIKVLSYQVTEAGDTKREQLGWWIAEKKKKGLL